MDLSIPTDLKTQFTSIDRAIAENFDTLVKWDEQFELAFASDTSNAVSKRIDFGGVATRQPGKLFAAIERLPTILVDLPERGEPVVFGDGRYSDEAANKFLNQQVHGKTLRDHVREQMGQGYSDLVSPGSTDAFLSASLDMKQIVESSSPLAFSERSDGGKMGVHCTLPDAQGQERAQ